MGVTVYDLQVMWSHPKLFSIGARHLGHGLAIFLIARSDFSWLLFSDSRRAWYSVHVSSSCQGTSQTTQCLWLQASQRKMGSLVPPGWIWPDLQVDERQYRKSGSFDIKALRIAWSNLASDKVSEDVLDSMRLTHFWKCCFEDTALISSYFSCSWHSGHPIWSEPLSMCIATCWTKQPRQTSAPWSWEDTFWALGNWLMAFEVSQIVQGRLRSLFLEMVGVVGVFLLDLDLVRPFKDFSLFAVSLVGAILPDLLQFDQ